MEASRGCTPGAVQVTSNTASPSTPVVNGLVALSRSQSGPLVNVTVAPDSGGLRTTPSVPTVGMVTCTARSTGSPTTGRPGLRATATPGVVKGVNDRLSDCTWVPPRKKMFGVAKASVGGSQARTR